MDRHERLERMTELERSNEELRASIEQREETLASDRLLLRRGAENTNLVFKVYENPAPPMQPAPPEKHWLEDDEIFTEVIGDRDLGNAPRNARNDRAVAARNGIAQGRWQRRER